MRFSSAVTAVASSEHKVLMVFYLALSSYGCISPPIRFTFSNKDSRRSYMPSVDLLS